MEDADAASSIPIAQPSPTPGEQSSQGPTLPNLACVTRCLQQRALSCLVLTTGSGKAAQVPVAGPLRTAKMRYQGEKRKGCHMEAALGDAGRRQRTNTMIHCSSVIKRHRLCNLQWTEIDWLILLEAGKFNVKVRQNDDLGSKIMPRMTCFYIAGGGRAERARLMT